MSVRFCSLTCQTIHWKAGHAKECPRLQKLQKECVIISPEDVIKSDNPDDISFHSAGEVSSTDQHGKPRHVAIDEPFTVKVQLTGDDDTILICDKTKECQFTVSPDLRGFDKILAKVRAEKVTVGSKTYMTASYDEKGNCALYVNQTKMKTW
jgi:hypothetical protein